MQHLRTSTSKAIPLLQVKWRTVTWGFGLQLAFALIILRWSAGFHAFKWLGDRVSEYLAYVNAGSTFLFGPNFRDHFFAMQVGILSDDGDCRNDDDDDGDDCDL